MIFIIRGLKRNKIVLSVPFPNILKSDEERDLHSKTYLKGEGVSSFDFSKLLNPRYSSHNIPLRINFQDIRGTTYQAKFMFGMGKLSLIKSPRKKNKIFIYIESFLYYCLGEFKFILFRVEYKIKPILKKYLRRINNKRIKRINHKGYRIKFGKTAKKLNKEGGRYKEFEIIKNSNIYKAILILTYFEDAKREENKDIKAEIYINESIKKIIDENYTVKEKISKSRYFKYLAKDNYWEEVNKDFYEDLMKLSK